MARELRPELVATRTPFLLSLFALAALGCGGGTSPPSTDAASSRSTDPDAAVPRDADLGDRADAAADRATPLDAMTCEAAGCTAGFTCAACPPGLVCDDATGHAKCTTTEELFGCGAGTRFCNSSCGICLLPGAPCVIDSCSGQVESCGAGAKCGTGTKCADDACVPK